MKKLLLLIVLLSPWLRAQTVSGSLTASDSGACSIANSCITLGVDQTQGAAGVALSGTFSATAQFEVSADKGVTWVAASGTPPGSTTTATSATAAGTWRFAVSGLTHIRVRCSAYTSGTIVASIVASRQAASLGGGGPGSITVPGSGSEFQIRLDSSTLQALSGSSISGTNAVFGGSVTGTSFITTGTTAGCIVLNEQASSGVDQLTVCSPNSLAASLTLLLPGADGTAGQAATTNGSGTMAFAGPSLTAAGGGTLLGNNTGASTTPAYTAAPILGIPGTTIGTLGFAGNTSGTVTVTPQATAGSPTITLPNATGTLADGATSPLTLSATTGNLTCTTCVTSAASLTSNAIVIGGGSQASSTISASTTTTNALFATAGAPAFRQPVAGDITNFNLVRAVTGTSDTVLAADCNAFVTYSNAAATAVTLPQATGSFAAPCVIHIRNLAAGIVTITPTTSTIDGLANIALAKDMATVIESNGTNWIVNGYSPGVVPVASATNFVAITPTITAGVPLISAIGSDTNIGITNVTKGSGSHTFKPGSNGTSAFLLANASGTSYLRGDSTNSRVAICSNPSAPGATLDICGKFFVDLNGDITKADNLTTAGKGAGFEVYNTAATSQTASITATTMITNAAADNNYRFHVYLAQLNAGTGCAASGSVGVNLLYTDAVTNSAYTIVLPIENSGGTALLSTLTLTNGTLAVANVGWADAFIRSKASTTVQISTTYTAGTGCSTGQAYNIYPVLEII